MTTPLCEKLPWDTAFFGINIARVLADTLDPTQAAAIDAWCHSEHIACLYFLARADDPATTRTAESNGYSLVDVRIELEKPVPRASPPASAEGPFELHPRSPGAELASQAWPHPTPPNIRPATPADLPALEPIARTSFTDSRFYADPHFPRDQCDALYVRWVQESVRGFADITLIAEQEHQAAGFATCKIENGTGHIGLVGVDTRFRGQGLGNALMQAAVSWFAGKGVPRITVVTQARNLPSQRLYQRHGFLTRSAGLYYHKWINS